MKKHPILHPSITCVLVSSPDCHVLTPHEKQFFVRGAHDNLGTRLLVCRVRAVRLLLDVLGRGDLVDPVLVFIICMLGVTVGSQVSHTPKHCPLLVPYALRHAYGGPQLYTGALHRAIQWHA